VKIYIGITQNPKQAKEYFEQKRNIAGDFTEFGPFMTMVDALNWLVYLKSLVANFEEIIPDSESDDAMWFGFTYEGQN